MAKINLLPWREERRRELKNQFILVVAAAATLGFGAVYFVNMQVGAQIEHQQARNEFIRQETAALDTQIAEIGELRRKREGLVERMNVIQNLQGNRPLIVHVFDEIVRTVPDGVFYKDLTQQGETIQASGLAESNTRISALMRNIDSSPHFSKPVLSKVESAIGAKGDEKEWSGFNMSFQVNRVQDDVKAGEG